jgi:two-component system, chemotaxis family, response regulator WspF
MRVGLASPSDGIRQSLCRTLQSTAEHQLAWVAGDGLEAVKCSIEDTPDLLLLDAELSAINVAEATRRIMSNAKCAILIVTSSADVHAGVVFEALGAGAVDLVMAPISGRNGVPDGTKLLSKIRTVGRLIGTGMHPPQGSRGEGKDLVAIGASAGGPAALATILKGIDPEFRAAIVIVQHLDQQFAPLMAEWLESACHFSVRVSQASEQPRPGVALLAGGDGHMVFASSGTLGYSREPRHTPYEPSLDVFFDSIVRHWTGRVVGVLLTGMGRDGALGLKALRNAGAWTIAQDRATSAVYGMPKRAAEVNAAAEILPLHRIAPALKKAFQRGDTP